MKPGDCCWPPSTSSTGGTSEVQADSRRWTHQDSSGVQVSRRKRSVKADAHLLSHLSSGVMSPSKPSELPDHLHPAVRSSESHPQAGFRLAQVAASGCTLQDGKQREARQTQRVTATVALPR